MKKDSEMYSISVERMNKIKNEWEESSVRVNVNVRTMEEDAKKKENFSLFTI